MSADAHVSAARRAAGPKALVGLRVIAIYKFIKAALLLGLAAGLFRAIHQNLEADARQWLRYLHIDPEHYYIRLFLQKIARVDPRVIRELSVGAFVSGGLFLAEGIGLWLAQTWAEYLVIGSTALFIPVEVLSCFQEFSWWRVALLVVNVAIAIYVAYLVWLRRRQRAAAGATTPVNR
jgi:uncharacterized membrane protein (DUF2068 family)